MRRALIGHTGFVGSNLRQDGFSDFFNSRNFQRMSGERFDEVVCAGVSAVKWLANREPENDWAAIKTLIDVLEEAKIGRFTLISTIDVYPQTGLALDEGEKLEDLDNHPYGRHRLLMEQWVRSRYPNHAVVRLPALFGPGLKKNALFDLLHGNQVSNINPAARFQWYPLVRLADDLKTVAQERLELVNLFTEPVSMQTIIDRLFPGAPVGPAVEPAPIYQLRTRHARLFGGANGYVANAPSVMAAMDDFICAHR